MEGVASLPLYLTILLYMKQACNMIMFKKILNVFDKERELLKIKSWLKNHDVFYKSSKYSYEYINNEWFVNSDSDIDIMYKDLKKIPFKFGIVNGSFRIMHTLLDSCDNFPKKITESLICTHNKIESFVGCTQDINNNVDFTDNMIGSFKGCPKIIKGYFSCNDNKITNFKDAPIIIEGHFAMRNNNIEREGFLEFETNCNSIALFQVEIPINELKEFYIKDFGGFSLSLTKENLVPIISKIKLEKNVNNNLVKGKKIKI